jgi:CTP-dependent riboflavin kinase
VAPGYAQCDASFDYIVHPSATIEPHEYRTGERIKLQHCRVRGHRMIIMRPDSHERHISGGANVLELISPLHLRTAWALRDRDELAVEVEGDQSWWERPETSAGGPT